MLFNKKALLIFSFILITSLFSITSIVAHGDNCTSCCNTECTNDDDQQECCFRCKKSITECVCNQDNASLDSNDDEDNN